MANRQQRHVRKLTGKDPHNVCYRSRVVQKVSHNGKKHDVFLEPTEVGVYAFVPSRKEVNNKARYKYPAQRKNQRHSPATEV